MKERAGIKVRMAVWNCNMAFRKKYSALLEYFRPDIMLIQECEAPDQLEDLSNLYDVAWLGENKHKGIATFVLKKYQFHEIAVSLKRVRHVQPVDLGFLKIVNVWAMNDRTDVRQRYIAQVWEGLRLLVDVLDSTTIIAGDFNWNAIWDKRPSYALYGKFRDVVGLLHNRGLVSAYHHFQNELFGKETHGTFFMHKKRKKQYHIDYLFLPHSLARKVTRFELGCYDDWITYSDHMPLFIEFSLQ